MPADGQGEHAAGGVDRRVSGVHDSLRSNRLSQATIATGLNRIASKVSNDIVNTLLTCLAANRTAGYVTIFASILRFENSQRSCERQCHTAGRGVASWVEGWKI